jgi:uncharacterized protein YbjT (DUF2867 family)
VVRIAVTGASGRIGGQVVRLVANRRQHQVVALCRRGLRPGRWPPGVSARAADYADPPALGAALRDVDTLVFVSSDVSRGDVARCLAALALAPASGRHHDITGSRSLDLDAIAAAGTREWGTPLRHVNIAPGEHGAEMAAAGEDPWWMYAYSTMFASIRDQRWAAVSAEIHRLTGRPPTPVRAALARYKAV